MQPPKKILPLLLALPLIVVAGEVEIVAVKMQPEGGGSYRFDVTLRHRDTGWEHYADGWQLLDPNGKLIAERILYHPHVNEQPFTRSLSGVALPASIDHLFVRAHDNVHGYAQRQWRVELPKPDHY